MKLSALLLMLVWSCITLANPYEETGKTNYVPIVQSIACKLGNRTITLKKYQFGNRKDIVMLNVHSNEKTAVIAAMQWLKINGGMLIKIENGDERNIRFLIDSSIFEFDPNHIFSLSGIQRDFENNKQHLEKAIMATQVFAKKILQQLPAKPSLVVALHNNFNGGFGIDDYLKGHERAKDAAKFCKNPALDTDDIFLTTDAPLYNQLCDAGFNTILQNIKTVKKDGSLSVYFHERNIRYVNCETEHDKQLTYLQMLTKALSFIERININENLLSFTSTDTSMLLQKGVALFKDSMYVGEIKSIAVMEDGKGMHGKLTIPITMSIKDTMMCTMSKDPNSGKSILKLTGMVGKVLKAQSSAIIVKMSTPPAQTETPNQLPIIDTLLN